MFLLNGEVAFPLRVTCAKSLWIARGIFGAEFPEFRVWAKTIVTPELKLNSPVGDDFGDDSMSFQARSSQIQADKIVEISYTFIENEVESSMTDTAIRVLGRPSDGGFFFNAPSLRNKRIQALSAKGNRMYVRAGPA